MAFAGNLRMREANKNRERMSRYSLPRAVGASEVRSKKIQIWQWTHEKTRGKKRLDLPTSVKTDFMGKTLKNL